jgi:hypothetical protein
MGHDRLTSSINAAFRPPEFESCRTRRESPLIIAIVSASRKFERFLQKDSTSEHGIAATCQRVTIVDQNERTVTVRQVLFSCVSCFKA